MVTGKKLDEGKPQAGLMCNHFADALMKVAEVTTYGQNKYAKAFNLPHDNWKNVENAETRYHNALLRHLLLASKEDRDTESGLLHGAHIAWNALALLQLYLEEDNNDNESRR